MAHSAKHTHAHTLTFKTQKDVQGRGQEIFETLSKFFPPTDAQLNCHKSNFKIHIKIDIKTAPTCFGAVTPSSGSTLLMLAEIIVVKIAN